MTVIDKAIVESASGKSSILSSAMSSLKSMTARPVQYVKSPMFLMMWATYGLTYATANSVRTVAEEIRLTKSQGQTALFAGTTVVNSGATMLKDRAYAKMFGQSASRGVPMVTYGLWGMRDCMVIGSSFVMPKIVGDRLVQDFGMDEGVASSVAQFSCPVLTQAVAGPVQLLGLDFFNRPMADIPVGQAFMNRLRFLKSQFLNIFSARVARIAPAYGIGGIGNTYCRDTWRLWMLNYEMRQIEHEIDEARRMEEATILVDQVLKDRERFEKRQDVRPFNIPRGD